MDLKTLTTMLGLSLLASVQLCAPGPTEFRPSLDEIKPVLNEPAQMRQCGLPASATSVALFSLELKRLVRQLPGKDVHAEFLTYAHDCPSRPPFPSCQLLLATSFFPPEWSGPSGRPSAWFLFVGLSLMAFGAFCFAGAIASADTLRKRPWLNSAEDPLTHRIGTAIGAVVFTVMGGLIVGGWFKLW